MEKTKLFRLFNILSNRERNRFEQTLRDKPEDVKRLYNTLKTDSRRSSKLEKKEVIKLLRCSEKDFNHLTSSMCTLIENFIISNELNMNDDEDTEILIQRELILLNYFRKKPTDKKTYGDNVSKLFKLKTDELNGKLQKMNERDIFYYINQYKLDHYLYHACSTDLRKEGQPEIQKILKSLDTFYCLAKLRFAAETKVRQFALGEHTTVEMLEEAHQLSETIKDPSPLIEIYKTQLALFQDFNKEKLVYLQELITNNQDKITRQEMAAMLSILLSHITRQVRQGNTELNLIYYDISKLILDKGYFITEGLIQPIMLFNFCAYAVKVDKSDEIILMLDKYDGMIPKSKYDHTKKLCNAFFLFGQEAYYDAYMELEKIKTHAPEFIIHKKILQLKCLYECWQPHYPGDVPKKLLSTACKSFKKHFNSDKRKISAEARASYIKFADMLTKIDDANTPKAELRKMIEDDYSKVVSKTWLLKKIEKRR